MCRREASTYACGHDEETTSRCGCKAQWSSIIPKRCLPGLMVPETKAVDGDCSLCVLKATNVRRAEIEKGMKDRERRKDEERKELKAAEGPKTPSTSAQAGGTVQGKTQRTKMRVVFGEVEEDAAKCATEKHELARSKQEDDAVDESKVKLPASVTATGGQEMVGDLGVNELEVETSEVQGDELPAYGAETGAAATEMDADQSPLADVD